METSVQQLASVFPQLSLSVIKDALLTSDMNVDVAACALFDVAPPAALDAPTPAVTSAPGQRAWSGLQPGRTGGNARKPARQKGWHNVSSQLSQANDAALPRAKFVGTAATGWALETEEFPSVAGSGPPAPGSRLGPQPQASGGYVRAAGQPHQPLGARAPKGAWQPARGASTAMRQQQPHHQQQQEQQQVAAPKPSSQEKLDALVSQLQSQLPWAQQELVQAVVEATGGDAGDAAAALQEMAPTSGQQAGGAPAAGEASASSTEGSDEDAGDAKLQQGSGPERQAAAHRFHPAGPTDAEDDPGGASSDDVYRLYRQEATRLTRRWCRLMRRAAAAYQAGHHTEGKQLAAEAARGRQVANKAHEEAAAGIEAALFGMLWYRIIVRVV